MGVLLYLAVHFNTTTKATLGSPESSELGT